MSDDLVARLIDTLNTEQNRTARYLERAERAEAERDALRRDAERYRIARWWLATAFAGSAQTIDEKIDAALREGSVCTCLGNDDIGHSGSCPRL